MFQFLCYEDIVFNRHHAIDRFFFSNKTSVFKLTLKEFKSVWIGKWFIFSSESSYHIYKDQRYSMFMDRRFSRALKLLSMVLKLRHAPPKRCPGHWTVQEPCTVLRFASMLMLIEGVESKDNLWLMQHDKWYQKLTGVPEALPLLAYVVGFAMVMSEYGGGVNKGPWAKGKAILRRPVLADKGKWSHVFLLMHFGVGYSTFKVGVMPHL